MNTQEAGEKVRQGRSVSTEQDSVRRLAEIRERAEKATPWPWTADVGFISWEELGYDSDELCCWQTAASAEEIARHPGFGACAEPDACEGHDAVPPRPALSMVEGPVHLNAESDSGWYYTGEDAEFIAYSREDVPYLLSLIDSLGNRIAEYERQDVVWVTRDEAAWLDQRADIEQRIDSLTAERDRLRTGVDAFICETNEAAARWAFTAAGSAEDLYLLTRSAIARAEAAEAEVTRLREALTAQVMWVNGNTDPLKAHTYDCSHKDLDPGDCTYLCMKIRAALAPPSEGGQSDGHS